MASAPSARKCQRFTVLDMRLFGPFKKILHLKYFEHNLVILIQLFVFLSNMNICRHSHIILLVL